MALLFMDSFDHYATADITEKWTLITSGGNGHSPVIGAYGRNGTQGIRYDEVIANLTHYAWSTGVTLAPADNVCIVGMAVNYSAASFADIRVGTSSDEGYTASNYLVKCMNNNDLLWFMRVNVDGTISVLRDLVTAVVLGTTSVALQEGVFAYVEVKVTVHGSAGTVDVRINGASAMTGLTGQNTRGQGSTDGWTHLRIGQLTGYNVRAWMDMDDFVVMDGSGARNNDFIGDVTISALLPTGDGNSHAWLLSTGTPDTGVDYQCVDDAVPNDDTDYVSTSTLTAKSTYAMQDCAAGADIRAVQVLASVRKGAEGPGQVKLVTRSNSTDYDGTAQGIGGTSYSYLRQVLETDPATSAAWLEAAWNAVEIGVKKTG